MQNGAADHGTAEIADLHMDAEQLVAKPLLQNPTTLMQVEGETLQLSSASNSASFTRHLMCKGHDDLLNPISPTTIFRPSDARAECLTTFLVNDTIEFKWYYRSNSSKTWVSCRNWSDIISGKTGDEYRYVGYLMIRGYWPGFYFPRGYKVDVYVGGTYSFSEFFEITNGGLNSPRLCTGFDGNNQPIDMKSRFTIGTDTIAYYYLRFDKVAYFNDELECCHNFTTAWIQPDGNVYQTYSGNFTDYKDADMTRNYWDYGHSLHDSLLIDSSTPVGNWKVEVYLDAYYLNGTWVGYGPAATTPFIVANRSVAEWTVMTYLDGDVNMLGSENATIDVFEKMASVGSASDVNIVAQMDRMSGQDTRYGDWTDCRRFNVTKGMTPTAENATLDLGEVDMGSPDTLKNFINWTICYYPANHYFLILWDHGAGCMGVCFDSTSGGDYLSLPKLSQALSGLPVIIDAMLIDACSMSMTEVAYQIKDYANVLIGPEGLGYGPPPYDHYISDLVTTPSISPNNLSKEVVADYMNWCIGVAQIKKATMSATDLTKIVNLIAAIDDFSIKLNETETLYHEQISMCRNQTVGYEGPYANDLGYFVDLYDFAQQISQHISDSELTSAALQVMATISVGNVTIAQANKTDADSHGLSIFFPDNKTDFYRPRDGDSYAGIYEKSSFAIDTLWDELMRYHLSGYVLTILTTCPSIQVKVGNDSYTTDANGIIHVFLSAGDYTIVIPLYVRDEELRTQKVFVEWNDTSKASSRTLSLNYKSLTLEATYETEYYLTVVSLYGQPTQASGWIRPGESIIISVESPTSGPEGTRYVLTSWNGTGSIPESGTNTTVAFTMDRPTRITWNWKVQHLLEVSTDPLGLSPAPNVSVPGLWYDNGTQVNCTAQEISGYQFDRWTVSGANWNQGVHTISLTMDGPRKVVARYVLPPAWWDIFVSSENIKVWLAVAGIMITLTSVSTAGIRTRRKRKFTKALLNQIDEVYADFKNDPRKCEDELCRLRNTILQGMLTDGKISEANHSIMDRKIEKYLEELQKRRKTRRRKKARSKES
jgi:hypothetical protein